LSAPRELVADFPRQGRVGDQERQHVEHEHLHMHEMPPRDHLCQLVYEMIACLDVGYGDTAVVTACVGFGDWPDAAPAFEEVVRAPPAAAHYVPGQLFRRELPFLLDLLGRLRHLPSVLIVDGYVWLGPGRKGLGATLHEALGGRAAVVGV